MRTARNVLLSGLVLGGLGMGCGETALFDLSINLPPSSEAFALVQVRSAEDFGFQELSWDSTRDPIGFALAPDTPTENVGLSVFADSSTLMKNALLVRISFCDDPQCTAEDYTYLPQVEAILERVFYPGEATSYELTVDTMPSRGIPTTHQVDRCAIEGCYSGPPTTTWFCEDMPEDPPNPNAPMQEFSDGRHYCEMDE